MTPKDSGIQSIAESQDFKQETFRRFHGIWGRNRDRVVGSDIGIGPGRVFSSNGSELAVDANAYQLMVLDDGSVYVLRFDGLRGSVVVAGPVPEDDVDVKWIVDNCKAIHSTEKSDKTEQLPE